MMLKLLLVLSISLLFQACQGPAEIASANQVAPTLFPGATLTTVLPNSGWKKLGDNLDITLIFPLPINVAGMPYINSQIGLSTRRFYYYSGTGSTTLVFRYTVTAADLDNDGVTFNSSVELNGGSLTFSPKLSTIENVPTSLSIPVSMIKVDGIVPYLSQVTAPNGGNFATGQQLKYNLLFSENVFVAGVPSFDINLTSGAVPANYRTGSGSNNLQFSRTLEASDSDIDGFITNTTLAMNALAGITISDEAGNLTYSVMYPTASTNILINVAQPVITSVTPPAASTYTLGQTLDFTVAFSEAVNVTGTPSIPIALNTGTVLATYLSGSGTTSLTFRYTVQTNHVDNNGITLISPLILNSGTVKNLAENQNAALIYTPPLTPAILIDAATGPYVTSVFAPNNGTYLEGQNLGFTLNFNSIVNITGSPRLPIIIGSSTVYASYSSGSGTSALVFQYTITPSDEDLDGISLSGPIDLSLASSSIRDTALKDAIPTYLPPNTTSIIVDGTSPTIISVASLSNGTVVQGQHLNFSVTFSEPVQVTSGTPTLSITVGGVSGYIANYISGTGTSVLNFRYTVQTGDEDLDGIDVNTPLIGTIKDLRNHNANLSFTSFTTATTGPTGVIVDASGSTVSSLIPPANQTYKIGDHIDFVVNWSEPTFISGSPRIVLDVGGFPVYANFESSPSSTSSIFRYTVLTNHFASAGIVFSVLELNGGSIRDATGNSANLTIGIPNLSGVIVDGVIPFVSSMTVPPNGFYGVGQSLNFILNWSEPIAVTSVPYLTMTIGTSTVNFSMTSSTANTTTFTYTILSGQLDTNGISILSAVFLGVGTSIKDLAGNSAYLQLNPPDLTGVIVDGIVPTISAVIPPTNKTYQYLENIDFTIVWSEPVTVSPLTRIGIRVGSNNFFATHYASTSTTSTYRYTVGLDESDSNGITITTNTLDGLGNVINSYIDLNAGSIVDIANNSAVATFMAPNLTGVLVDGITAIIDPLNPITAPASGLYGPNRVAPWNKIQVIVNWNKTVYVDTSGGTPYIYVFIGSVWRKADYTIGDGSPNLTFEYTLVAGDVDTDGIHVLSPVYLNGGTIEYTYIPPFPFPATNYSAKLTYSPSWIHYPGVIVDGIAPVSTSITSTNISAPSRNNIFYPGEIIQYNVTFSEAVTKIGSPSITINVGGVAKTATLYNYLGPSTTLTFRYTVDAANAVLDLDGINVSTSMTFPFGAFILDQAGNVYNGALSFSEKDYVYYSNVIARYDASSSGYNSALCSSNSSEICVVSLLDLTGNGNDLLPAPGMDGPVHEAAGYAGNSTPYLQFNNSSLLRMTTNMNVKYVVFVLKQVSDASTSIAISNHQLLRRNSASTLSSAIEFTSTSLVKEILMNPAQKHKINGSTFGGIYETSASTTSLWSANTDYIMIFELNANTTFEIGSAIGGLDFNGQIAEMFFLSGTATLTEAQLNKIRDGLNTIHDVY